MFNKKPQSVQETLEMLFPNETDGDVWFYDNSISKKSVAEDVFNDLQNQTTCPSQIVIEQLTQRFERENGGYCYSSNHPEVKKLMSQYYQKYNTTFYCEPLTDEQLQDKLRIEELMDGLDLEFKQRAQKQALDYYNQHFRGKDIYSFTYSDNDGKHGTLMEHGDIFRHLPHVRISNH